MNREVLRRWTKWESHCRCCGLCCYQKRRLPDGCWEIDLSRPCPWLDEQTRLCRIYSRRLRVYPLCRRVNIWRALFAPYLPPSCGYVMRLRPRWLPRPRVALRIK
ncbi:MAG: hypothetical protein CSA76_03145 [Spirochaetales bacterium]|nr:MAG: hypothetical protein CSA76_03145 [Spirochaetales bacterium]